MSRFARTCAAFALALGAAGTACGHLPFDDLSADSDAGSSGGGVDGGLNDDGSIDNRDGGGGSDGGPRDDGGGLDGGGPCTGPTCVGTFVSGSVGKDTSPGTADKPVQTITKAIEIATALGGKQNVYVAASHYTEKITVAEGVSLLGGYLCDPTTCTWSRDTLKNDTVILNTDFEGVFVPKTVTKKTLIDGFRITGKAGSPTAAPGGAAITIISGTPVIARCRITAGDANGGVTNAKRSIGIAVLGPMNDGAGATIEANQITGGSSTDESAAILLNAKPGSSGAGNAAIAVIVGNTIKGGSAPSTTGLMVLTSGAKSFVHDNTITAGSATNGGGANNGSWAVLIASAISLDGNHINTDFANTGTCTQNGIGNACGGIISKGATATLTNNIVFGVKSPRSAALMLAEGEGGLGDVIVNANLLDGAGNGGGDGTISAAIALYLSQGNTGSVGKVRNNILRGGLNKGRYGVYEEQVATKTAHLIALENNDFWNDGTPRDDFAYHTWNGTAFADVTFGQLTATITTPIPTSNIAVDPQVDTSFHLASTSQCINKGTLTESPARDIDGDQRPKGNAIDIGADEAK